MTSHPVWGSVWLRSAISTAILVYLAFHIDISASLTALLRVNPTHLIAVLVLVGLDRSLMICRWLLLLRSSGQQIAVKSVAWIFLVSSFIGSVLPTSLGGDAARAYTLSRRTDDTSEAIASVTIDRLSGVLSLALTATVGAVVWGTANDSLPVEVIWTIVVLAGLGCTSILWIDRLLRDLIPNSWHESLRGAKLIRLADALSRYRCRRPTLVGVFGLSVSVQLLRVVQAYLLGLGLGIDVNLSYYLVFMPIGLLMLLLPVSIAGFGLPQGVIVWLLRPQGVTDSLSFALSTLIILTGLAGNIPGAWLYVRSKI